MGKPVRPDSLTADLIAPCGMDCGLCIGHLRSRKPCPGCNGEDSAKPGHCVSCRIKLCDERPEGRYFCFDCWKFPCARVRRLDTRYRSKYHMSMLENLERIRDGGIEKFVAAERVRWECAGCGGVVCVHSDVCLSCGRPIAAWTETSAWSGTPDTSGTSDGAP